MNIGLWTTNTIPAGIAITIPPGQVKIIYGTLTLQGRLTIQAGGVLALLDGELINDGGTLTNNGTLVEKGMSSVGDLEQIKAIAYQNLLSIEELRREHAVEISSLHAKIASLHEEIASLQSWLSYNILEIDDLKGRAGPWRNEQSAQNALLALLLKG